MIKILHCADIHLDSPFSSENAVKSEIRRNELRAAFTSMTAYAKDNGAGVVLIAGDLFDAEYVTNETIAIIAREFENNPGCRFIISPGNHDPFTQNSAYNRLTFPDNVFIFNDGALSYFSFDDLGLEIYGYAFVKSEMEKNPFAGCAIRNKDAVNILCAHGDTTPGSKYCPITKSEIEKSGFDYIALGHIHNGGGVEQAGKVKYAYPGCLEGRDYSEAGYKGALWLEIEDKNISISNVRFSKRRYETAKLNITGASSMPEVLESVRKFLIYNNFGEDTLLRLQLAGNVTPSLTISRALLKEQIKNLFDLEIIDKTLPLYDYGYLKNDPTIKGAFFEKLLPVLTEGGEAERELAGKALRYGLSAVTGSDIIDFEI